MKKSLSTCITLFLVATVLACTNGMHAMKKKYTTPLVQAVMAHKSTSEVKKLLNNCNSRVDIKTASEVLYRGCGKPRR